jgi:hypothetical protein
LPPLEKRLRDRYRIMVLAHLHATQRLASGISALPEATKALSATQAAYRFLHNPHIKLRDLAAPLLKAAHQAVADTCEGYVLVIHDWSQVPYRKHHKKADRLTMSAPCDLGYKLQVALAVSDREGAPLAPLLLRLYAADGVHTSEGGPAWRPGCPLDEIAPAMAFVERQKFTRPVVHILDAEGDSVGHLRQWNREPLRRFVVRGENRWVEHEGRELRCAEWQAELRAQNAFRFSRPVEYHGRKARQYVAELSVRLLRPAYQNRQGKRRVVPGEPLPLRLVISEVRDEQSDNLLATWFLLTNVDSSIPPATIALWYYWRWRIETFFKLLKSAGLQLEDWKQQTADTVARRLLVASMACVVVWQLARNPTPQADQARQLLVQLSGRTMARGTQFTMPALLAGLWVLLAMLNVLEHYNLDQLRALAKFALPDHATRPP